MITFKRTKTNKDADSIRQAVFLQEQGFSTEFDPIEDAKFEYIIAYDNDKPIGLVRMRIIDGKAILGRLAVLKEYRKQKIGQQLVKQVEAYFLTQGINQLHLHAQQPVMPFYEKLGYTAYGEFEMDEFMPHCWMKKEITE